MSTRHSTAPICEPCSFEPFVRNNYFTGKMMGAAEFIAETRYHQEKLRLHQVRLHGWGVVCGLEVVEHGSPACRPRYVIVRPGSAVDCCGNDILVPDDEVVDLLGYKAVAALAQDDAARRHTLALCIRFEECATETVPVLYDDCGCSDDACAPNRILESYAFDVLVDPPLGGGPRLAAADVAGGVFLRPPDAALTGPTPRIGPAALAGGRLYALDAAEPTTLVIYDLASRHTDTLDLGAAAYGLAAQADMLFVATAPPSGGTAPVLQVLKPGDAAPVIVEAAGLAATDTLMIAASSDAARAAIAYDRTTGALLGFAPDATAGLQPPTAIGTIAAGLIGFVASPDGADAFATDGVAVTRIALATGTTSMVAALPAGTKPAALALSSDGAWLAVADAVARRLHIVDIADDTLVATVPLDHPPSFVATGPELSIAVVEEEGPAAFLQTVDLTPLATSAAPLVSAPRAIEGTGERLVVLGAEGEVGVAASFDRAGVPCDELVWNQPCASCDTGNCVILATIDDYVAGAAVLDASEAATPAGPIARIDNRDGRKVLASAATLQAWLECLELKGTVGRDGKDGANGTNGRNGTNGTNGRDGTDGTNGANGADGLGLNPKLPKIIDVGWTFEEAMDINAFYQALYPLSKKITAGADPAQLIKNLVAKGARLPPLTFYFDHEMTGITRQTLIASFSAPLYLKDGGAVGIYNPTDLRPYGDVVVLAAPVTTPHTGEQAAFIASFIPSHAFFATLNSDNPSTYWISVVESALINLRTDGKVEGPLLTMKLKGDFVVASAGDFEGGILDADNIGGRVGTGVPRPFTPPLAPPLVSPSGNLAQGGLFEGWFWLKGQWKQGGQTPGLNTAAPDEIVAAAGVSTAVARRIVAAREASPISDLDDLAGRIRLSNADLSKLRSAFEPS